MCYTRKTSSLRRCKALNQWALFMCVCCVQLLINATAVKNPWECLQTRCICCRADEHTHTHIYVFSHRKLIQISINCVRAVRCCGRDQRRCTASAVCSHSNATNCRQLLAAVYKNTSQPLRRSQFTSDEPANKCFFEVVCVCHFRRRNRNRTNLSYEGSGK